MASEPASGRVRRFTAHRAGAALDARLGLLRPARDRPDPLPAVPRHARSAGAISSRTSTSGSPSPGCRDRGDRGRRQPACAAETGVRSRRFDRDDRRWLRGRRAPQGRFNAGQKLNAILTVAFALLFALSGFFLWLGERDHRFIFAGTGTVARHPHVPLGRPARRPPLSRADPPEHATRAPRDDDGRGRRGLGAKPPREVGGGGAPIGSAITRRVSRAVVGCARRPVSEE